MERMSSCFPRTNNYFPHLIIKGYLYCFIVDASTFYLHCLTVGTCFSARGILSENVIAFSSDNCSLMKGRHNSVLTRIKAVQPHALDIGCICHLANMCCQQRSEAVSSAGRCAAHRRLLSLQSQCKTQGAVSLVLGLLRHRTAEDSQTR